MIDPEETIQILLRDNMRINLYCDAHKQWHCTHTAWKSEISGPDASILLAQTIEALGLTEANRQEIFAALSKALRGQMN